MPDITDNTSGLVIDEDQEPLKPNETPLSDANATVVPDAGVSSKNLDALFTQMTGQAPDGSASKPTPTAKPSAEDDEDASPVLPSAEEIARVAAERLNATRTSDTHSALDNAIKAVDGDATAAKAKEAEDAEKLAKEKEDAAAADTTKKAATDADALDNVKLPEHAKAKSREAFDQIKTVARKEIADRDAKIKELTELAAKIDPKKQITPELQKELDDLREWRRAHDYKNSDEFKNQFESPLAETHSAIENQFKKVGFSDDQIKQAQAIGYDKLDWDAVFAKIPQSAKINFQALLLSRNQQTERRDKALADAGPAAKAFTEKLSKQEQERRANDEALSITAAKQIVDAGKYLEKSTLPANASAEDKLRIEAHNAFIDEQNVRFKELLADRSPLMHGSLVAGTILAFQLKRESESLRKRAEAAEASIAKIAKSSSTARVARAATKESAPAPQTSFLTPVADALDRARDEILSRQR